MSPPSTVGLPLIDQSLGSQAGEVAYPSFMAGLRCQARESVSPSSMTGLLWIVQYLGIQAGDTVPHFFTTGLPRAGYACYGISLCIL